MAEEPKGWRIGAPWGVPIYLSSTWPLLAVFMVVYFGPQVRRAVPEVGASAYLVAALYAVLLMLSVLAHEAAHAGAARATGARVGRIVLDLFGGHTMYEAGQASPGRSAVVAVVGPLANGVLAALGWALLPFLPDGVPWLVGAAFVISNAAVGAFNLIPGHPLDGGHLLEAAIWKATGRRDRGLLVSGWAGRLVALAVAAWFVLGPVLQGGVPSMVMLVWVGLMGVMLWSGATEAVRAAQRLRAYGRVSVPDVLVPVLVVPGDLLVDEVLSRAQGVAQQGRAPLVVVGESQATADDWLVFGPPAWLTSDPAAANVQGMTADSMAARPRPGWIVDMEMAAAPTLASIVDHMHEVASTVILVRRDGVVLGAVTASTVTTALERAGLRS